MGIGIDELIALKVGINQAAEAYGFTPSAAALHVINVIKEYNKRGQLKHELYELNLQKYAISQFCSGHRCYDGSNELTTYDTCRARQAPERAA
ncbi:MAG: hypothetical protein ACJ72J_18735 [Nitrososphaeraceae archaeon]